MNPSVPRSPRRGGGGGHLSAAVVFALAFFSSATLCSASHSLGSLIDVSPVGVGPDHMVMEYIFSDLFSDLKYLILNCAASIGEGDRVEIVVGGNVVETFDSVSNPAFWTVPINSNTVTIRYIDDDDDGIGGVTLQRYGRGEEIDLFLLVDPFDDPAPGQFNSNGVCPNGANPSWQNANCPFQPGDQRDVSESVGMLVFATESGMKLTSCTATLINSAEVLTAGHCIAGDETVERESASFTFDFWTTCGGSPPPPPPFDPTFYKVIKTVRSGFARQPWDDRPSIDYTILRIDTGGSGSLPPPIPIKTTTPPALGEQLFIVHHPRGATKKISNLVTEEGDTCKVTGLPGDRLVHGCDIDNGSSGSAAFDLLGRVVAVNNWAYGPCNGQSLLSTAISEDLLTEPSPPQDADVVLVLDKSGSMGLTGESGDTKMEEAKEAAALFVDLLQIPPAAAHNIGLVSFSSTASLDFNLQPVNEGAKTSLIGDPPDFPPGTVVGDLSAAGLTAMGQGLQGAQDQFLEDALNRPIILLMTDGMQNVGGPYAEEVDLGDTRLCAVGFGTEASLDGPLLTTLATESGGIYTRASDGLDLKKFFVLCFGNIFNGGISVDPPHVIEVADTCSEEIEFQLCGETSLTVVVGWDDASFDLEIKLQPPTGVEITKDSFGVESSSGKTWAYLRFDLPYGTARDGVWNATVCKITSPGPLRTLQAQTDVTFFLTIVINGGPLLRPMNNPRIVYTGNAINPLVRLLETRGTVLPVSTKYVEVQRPILGAGNLLKESFVPVGTNPDILDDRINALLDLESASASPLIPFETVVYNLTEDHGVLEHDGVLGLFEQDIIAEFEGTHTFRAVVEYLGNSQGTGCRGTRETTWSTHVRVGVDADKTQVVIVVGELRPDGDKFDVEVCFTPRDVFESYLGPGQLSSFDIGPIPGVQIVNDMLDKHDGSYCVDIIWDPFIADAPGIQIEQPERPPVEVTKDPPANLEPICVHARANVTSCWPPNHKFEAMEVVNVLTFDGTPATIEITDISHNEMSNPYSGKGRGDGNKEPDWKSIDSDEDGAPDKVMVRCERSGRGNGRIYTVSFTAYGSTGGVCNDTVSISVPKNNALRKANRQHARAKRGTHTRKLNDAKKGTP